jgi:hypothetical protein
MNLAVLPFILTRPKRFQRLCILHVEVRQRHRLSNRAGWSSGNALESFSGGARFEFRSGYDYSN